MNSKTTRLKRSLTNDESKRSPTKRQFRNENEKRRRDLFSQLITNLEEILEIQSNSSSPTNKLDKASILRETATFLRKHQNQFSSSSSSSSSSTSSRSTSTSSSSSSSSSASTSTSDRSNEIVDFTWKPSSSLVNLDEWIQILIESMNCFLLITKSDPYNGQIVYVSKNISSFFDYSQEEVLNRSLFEFVSSRDEDHLRDYFLKEHQILDRCSVGWRRATREEFEHCSIIGAFRSVTKKEKILDEFNEKYLMSIVQIESNDRTLILHQDHSIDEFTLRLNLQGKLIHFDLKACEYLGYHPDELIGQTYLNYIHPDDLPVMIRAHQLWKDFGNGRTDPYRFLSKGQQWIFFQTNCQVQMNSWTGKAEFYLCKTNILINSNDSITKQISSISNVENPLIDHRQSLTTNNSLTNRKEIVRDDSTNEIQRKSSPDESQITSFLSQLSNEFYRKNIREKFVERRTQKQSEIRLREEEIVVIDDMIKFIDNYQTKHLTTSNQSNHFQDQSFLSSSSNQQNNSQLQKTFLQEMNLFRSSFNSSIDEYSLQSSLDQQYLVQSPLLLRSTSTSTTMTTRTTIDESSKVEEHCSSSPCEKSSFPLIRSVVNRSEEIEEILQSTTNSSDCSTRSTSFNRSLPHSLVS